MLGVLVPPKNSPHPAPDVASCGLGDPPALLDRQPLMGSLAPATCPYRLMMISVMTIRRFLGAPCRTQLSLADISWRVDVDDRGSARSYMTPTELRAITSKNSGPLTSLWTLRNERPSIKDHLVCVQAAMLPENFGLGILIYGQLYICITSIYVYSVHLFINIHLYILLAYVCIFIRYIFIYK
jgi:hypothetical protein